MVVSSISQCYLYDLPDIRVSSIVGGLTASITVGDSTTVEHYQPSGGSVTISGLADYVKDYVIGSFPEIEIGGAFDSDSSILLTINFSDDASSRSISVNVKLCREPLGITSDDFFLTRYKSKTINIGEPFLISYANPQRSLKVIAYSFNGESDYFVYSDTGSSSSNRRTWLFDASFIVSELSVSLEDLESVTFQLLQGTTVLDTINVTINHHGNVFSKTFIYDNIFFVPEAITFRGGEIETPVIESNFAYVNNKYSRLSADQYRLFTTRLGYSDENTYRSAEDILLADDVHMVEPSGKWTPIVITAVENSYSKPKTQPATFAITYRESGKRDQSFNRTTTRLGLFDKPFSKTFD